MAGEAIFCRKTSALWIFFLRLGIFYTVKLLFIDFRATTIYAEAQCPPSTRKSAPVMKDEPSASK
jgi:hypothetical protein